MSEKKPQAIASEEAEANRKRRQERFGMTPENTMRIGPDGKPMPWVVPEPPEKQ